MSKFTELEDQINQFLNDTDVVYHGENMLARMQDLVNALGNPEKQLKIIHVAGTSGKTSTCYFAASLLQSAGFTTGLTVSPHVDSVRERAIINLAPLPEDKWVAQMEEFFAIVQETGVEPSYFEFYMAFAYWLFAKMKLDYAVIETGLGGLWDGSNIARGSDKINIITDIGYDHTEILGENLAAIAKEKAGIIHEGNTTFMYPQSPEIMASIKARTEQMHGGLHVIENVTKNFMVRNFNLSKATVEFLLQRDHKPPLTPMQTKQARSIQIPARAEQIKYQGKTIIMDGSHNPQKLQAFVKYLNQRYPSSSRTLVATLGSNKLATLQDSMNILRQISDQLILTSFHNESLETHKRSSIDADSLVSAAKTAGFTTCEYIDDPPAALQAAIKQSTEQVIITGSFYLLDHLRPHLLSRS
ncbi:Mur ligase family protein [Candidatus Saccharibacteria bacterium]|nr:Mur ligase family protein [Candidatus Saccharibacteria bacterium]